MVGRHRLAIPRYPGGDASHTIPRTKGIQNPSCDTMGVRGVDVRYGKGGIVRLSACDASATGAAVGVIRGQRGGGGDGEGGVGWDEYYD